VPFIEDRALFALAEPEDGESVTAARSIARENEMVLVYPFFERDGDNFYNSAIVFGRRGEKLTKYRKHTVPSSRLFKRLRNNSTSSRGISGSRSFRRPSECGSV
jgi:predicted amidohydrolase